jgi:hypothetical protein
MGVGIDLEACEKNLARGRHEMVFLVISHYKIRGRPTQARARPEPSPKTQISKEGSTGGALRENLKLVTQHL